MGFSSQEYWNGFPWLSPGGLPNPGIEPTDLLHLLRWQADSLPLVLPGKGLLLGRLAIGEADWAQLLKVRTIKQVRRSDGR